MVPRYRGRHPALAAPGGEAAEETMPEAVITGGARTAVGRLLGSLKDLAATDLGGIVIKAALERSGVTGGDVQYVIMGQVLQAGTGHITAAQAAVGAAITLRGSALTLNSVCLPVLFSLVRPVCSFGARQASG